MKFDFFNLVSFGGIFVLSAPAAIVMAKIMAPKTGTPLTLGTTAAIAYEPPESAFTAIITGANDGLKLVVGTAALVPSRMRDLSVLGVKAVVAATFARLMTACVAGLFATGGTILFGHERWISPTRAN